MLFLVVPLVMLVCGVVGLGLFFFRVEVWWRGRRGVSLVGDRRTARRSGAGLLVCLGVWTVGAAVLLPWAPAFKDPIARVCFDRGTPTELVGIVGQEATRADPEGTWWPLGVRCTWSHHAYDGTITDQSGWDFTVLAGAGALGAVTGATTLIRTRGRDRRGVPVRT